MLFRSLVASLFISEAGMTPVDVILAFIVYAILVLFGYKGHRWALIALLILWIIDKLYPALTVAPRSAFTSILFLVVGAVAIVRALDVATERKTTDLSIDASSIRRKQHHGFPSARVGWVEQ